MLAEPYVNVSLRHLFFLASGFCSLDVAETMLFPFCQWEMSFGGPRRNRETRARARAERAAVPEVIQSMK